MFAPGVTYFKYEDLGPIADASKYNRVCKQCWPSGLKGTAVQAEEKAGEFFVFFVFGLLCSSDIAECTQILCNGGGFSFEVVASTSSGSSREIQLS